MRFGDPALTVRWSEVRHQEVRLVSHFGERPELLRELGLPDLADDTAILTAAYRRWGSAAPARLAGPFAFALVDPVRRAVLLGRDQLGQLPLYYAAVPGGVAVSMDLDALLAHPQVGDDVDLELAACQYALAYLPMRDRTPFRQVAKVQAGTVLEVSGAGIVEHRYWHPEAIEVEERGSVQEWAERFRDVLQRVVADALPPSRAVGAHLSGGLDSTAVAVLAQQRLQEGGPGLAGVYSWAPPPAGPIAAPQAAGPLADERWLVEQVAHKHGWHVRYVPDDPGLRAATAGADPLTRPQRSWAREAWVARDAASRGISVLLTGYGGDEAASFNGRGAITGLVDQGRWLTAYREVLRWSRMRGRPLASPRAALAVLRHRRPSAAARLGARADRLSELRIKAWQRRFPVVGEALREQHEMIVKRPRSVHDAQLALLELGHLAGRCESWAATGAAAGVSYRHPLLDPRLVELALSAPPACFWSDGWTRPAFRLAVEPLLPPAVTWNPSKEEPVLNPVLNELYGDEPRSTHPRGVQLAVVEAARAEVNRALLAANR